MFEQYAAILQHKYPSLTIEGENFPPPFYKQKMASFLVIYYLEFKFEYV